MEWTSMDAPLVWKLPNSMNRLLPGIWISKPGVSNMKSTTATNTGPQSDIFFTFSLSLTLSTRSLLLSLLKLKVFWVAKNRLKDDYKRWVLLWERGRDKELMTWKVNVTASSYTHSHYTPHTHYGQGNFECNTHIVHVYYWIDPSKTIS